MKTNDVMNIPGNLYLEGKPGRTCIVGGQEFLFFSGYNYLGVNEDEEFIALVNEGITKYGWVFPSSRISNTRLALYEECEAMLSAITGTEETVLMPSGYAAGRMSTSYFEGFVLNAPGSHPAILQGKPPGIDFQQWKDWLLNGYVKPKTAVPLVIASDSVSPLTAQINDFSFLSDLPPSSITVIDDSHGIGLIGENGNGISAALPYDGSIEYLLTYSLAKAFGIAGGAVSCTSARAAFFRSLPEYTGITPLSPAQIYAFIKGQLIYQRQREKLRFNINYFKNCISSLTAIRYAEGFPVFVLPPGVDEKQFFHHGILISSFSYPDPAGQKLNRIVLNALHTKDDLEKLANVLRMIYPT